MVDTAQLRRVQLPKMELKDHEQVYPPAEDSQLLQRVIMSGIVPDTNRILDMCTGSGVQAITLAKTYPSAKITAVDHNKYAVEIARENCITNGAAKVTVIQSNLFSKVKDKFDLIVCNPPYLPAHKFDRDDLLNTALVGGKKGNEVILQFLDEVKEHISDTGVIYLLFSSFSNKDVIDMHLKKSLFTWSVVASDYIGGFESLYVYKLQLLPHLSELQKLGVTKIEYLSQGKRGIVLSGKYDGEHVAIKIAQNRLQGSVIQKETLFLKRVNDLDIGPRLIESTDSLLIMEFIDGVRITDFIEKASHKDKVAVIKLVLEQLYLLDCNGIAKSELTNPYKHILITKKKKPVLIDFERANFATYPNNITQFMQFVQSEVFNDDPILKCDSERMTKLLQNYKFSRSRESFDELISLIK